ncbi:MAG TPA: phosphatase PAP2 family protein [Thermoanaerobaculia bacterium]|nr:phosphatase PAP2 family protein [Thermoanaerobaculia bacterium]
MFRTNVRAEDVLTVGAALGLVLLLGGKSIGRINLSEANYWDFSFLLLPIAILVLSASIRYAFRPIGEPAIREVTARTAVILRDWSPFLVFLMLYESFLLSSWNAVAPVDKDTTLLRWDRALFGETPSIPMDAWVRPWLTQVMVAAYFLHLILPPVMGLIWYRRDLLVFRQFLLSVLVCGIVGMQGYVLMPGIGPGFAFPALYHHPLGGGLYENITGLLDTARAMRDVFPSLHVAISSIVLWYAWRRGRALFLVALPLVVANWMSTLYLRYHYMVDVCAGWLTAVVAIALAAWILRVEAAIRARVSARSAGALRSTAPPPPSPR